MTIGKNLWPLKASKTLPIVTSPKEGAPSCEVFSLFRHPPIHLLCHYPSEDLLGTNPGTCLTDRERLNKS